MLAIQTYLFKIGTKIPFTQWPDLVQTYLRQQGLTYDSFHYYFEGGFYSCQKAVKDCPKMEPIRETFPPESVVHRLYLTNLEDGTGCTEADIMALLPKIYRRYGFSDTYLIYQDVDFFSNRIPRMEKHPCKHPTDIKGASIACFRDGVFPKQSGIILRIVIGDGQKAADPTSYLEGMKQLLPGIDCTEYVECCLSEEEQARYDALHEAALPLVERVRGDAEQRFPKRVDRDDYQTPSLNAAPFVKRLCKRYGYRYIRHENSTCGVEKRTPNGHCLVVYIGVTPLGKHLRVMAELQGVGFDHCIGACSWGPPNQQELESYLTEVFTVLETVAGESLAALDAHYPPTPHWYMPKT
ncbi:MAG: hypothetical protein IJD81_07720 [Oscillospiraceae bacterium]|nr:hypothetical protein [Oscillospiraceae bacterium]